MSPLVHALPRCSGFLICKFIALLLRSCRNLTTAVHPTIPGETQLARVCFIVSPGQTKLGSCYVQLEMLRLIPRPLIHRSSRTNTCLPYHVSTASDKYWGKHSQGKSSGDSLHKLSENFVCPKCHSLHSLVQACVACEGTPNYLLVSN